MFKVLRKTLSYEKSALKSFKKCEKRHLMYKDPTTIFLTREFSDSNKKIYGKTPTGKLDTVATEKLKEDATPDPYAPFPDGTNPVTGEIGGPKGPEPTRYGDWERKGRVSDF